MEKKLKLSSGKNVKFNPIRDGIPELPMELDGKFPAISCVHGIGKNFRYRGWEIVWYDTEQRAKEEMLKWNKHIESFTKTKHFLESLGGGKQVFLLNHLDIEEDLLFKPGDIVEIAGIKNFSLVFNKIKVYAGEYEGSLTGRVYHNYDYLDWHYDSINDSYTIVQGDSDTSLVYKNLKDLVRKQGLLSEGELEARILRAFNKKVDAVKEKMQEYINTLNIIPNELPRCKQTGYHLRLKFFI